MILLVDDDPSVTASLGLLLKQKGLAAHAEEGPEGALAFLEQTPCDLVLTDMNFSRRTTGEEGLALLEAIKRRHPELPVVLLTAWGSIPLAVSGMKLGAADFVTKPWTNEALLQSLETALGLAASAPLQGAAALSREELDTRYDFGALAGDDPRLLRVLEIVGRVAPTGASVLVTGENGTGKELVAEALHRNSKRRDRAFVKVNLGGVSQSLFESELFGHVRGAFTDARADRKGRFELAEGGTIFLDEIGELDASSQVKLLRVLQDRTYEILGSSAPQKADVRVVSATNRDLHDLVSKGQFREDLLYRLNLIHVHLPPLRERPGDVRLLSRLFLRTFAETYGREVSLTPSAERLLATFPWPGNVRQLRQTLERAILVAGKDTLDATDFQSLLQTEGRARPSSPVDPLPPVGSMTLEEIERAMIAKSLKHHEGNLTRVAESLGMSRPALYRRLEKYGLSS